MIRNIAILSLLTVLCVCPSASAQVSLMNTNPVPSARNLNRYGLEVDWIGQATMEVGRDKIQHISIDERSLVAITATGMVTMFDAETGEKLWVNRIGRGTQATFEPVMNDDEVLIVTGMTLYSLDRVKGDIKWNILLPQMASTAPSADDNQIYVGTLDGSVYAFDLRKINKLYNERLLPDYSLATRVWRYKTAQKITSPPVSYGRAVSFASLDKSLYTVSAATRKLLFQFETDAPISAPLTIHNEYMFLASEDYNFYCLNAKNGQVRWSFLSGLPIRKAPYIIEGTIRGVRTEVVYVLPEAGGMSALDAYNGFPIWSEPQKRAVDFRAATQNFVFVTDAINNILILERNFGEVVGMIPATSFNVATPNSRTDRLFLVRDNGLIVMIRESDDTYPTYFKYPERRPLTPEIYNPEMHDQEDGDSSAVVPGEDDSNGSTLVPGEDNGTLVPGEQE
ncbi:PQQ-binding-like beta-propeller repeat protein [uncultured Rubinisphaera sp.]|uniref:outer membrane protein assembly factor BamB family protein n=1 Tax=uncultured Rubinisphaera sp. TaxID=1678686 RepID=UPI0030D769F4